MRFGLFLMLLFAIGVSAFAGETGAWRRQRTIGFDKPRSASSFPDEIPENNTDTIQRLTSIDGSQVLLFPKTNNPEKTSLQDQYLRFAGFDKKGSSTTESMFVTNLTDSRIHSMRIEIRYEAMDGRQYHQREVNIDCSIPSGETRKVDFRSWDTQRSFRYHRSLDSKSSATPFKVRVRLLSLTLHR